ncbi:MAG: polyhydroxyalkanoate depolymerase [Pseudomonadota bacterium]
MWLDARVAFQDGPAPDVPGLAFRAFCLHKVRRGGDVVPVEESIAGHLPFAQMRRFRRAGDARRVLVVAPLAGGFPLLMRDLVAGLLRHAGEVCVTDWPDPRHVPPARTFTFEDNCLETARMIRALGPGAHVVGVCQGVVPALCAALLLAEQDAAPASLTLLGGPVDPSRNPTHLDRLLTDGSAADFERLMEPVPPPFAGAGRRVFPRRRQMQAFALYLWRQALAGDELPLKLWADEGEDPLFFPLARLCWDMMDIPAEFFLTHVDAVFRRRALTSGTLELAGRRLRPELLTRCALLTAEAERDDISAPGQTEAAHDLCRAVPRDLAHHILVPRAGHFSLFYGRAMRDSVLPAIARTLDLAEART